MAHILGRLRLLYRSVCVKPATRTVINSMQFVVSHVNSTNLSICILRHRSFRRQNPIMVPLPQLLPFVSQPDTVTLVLLVQVSSLLHVENDSSALATGQASCISNNNACVRYCPITVPSTAPTANARSFNNASSSLLRGSVLAFVLSSLCALISTHVQGERVSCISGNLFWVLPITCLVSILRGCHCDPAFPLAGCGHH